MIYSGFKTFTKGDTTLETGAQVYDFVKGAKNLKGKYDTYKEFIDIKRLKDAGDVAASLQKYDDLVRAGKPLHLQMPSSLQSPCHLRLRIRMTM